MSKTSNKVVDSEERIDTIVGVITVIVALALVVWLFVGISGRNNAITELMYEGEMRRGQQQTFTATVNPSKIKGGEHVKWIVDGKVIAEDDYVAGEPLTLNYAPEKSGQGYVTVQIGKYNQTAYFDAMPPKLTVAAPNVVITYGEELPKMDCECTGFVGDDCRETLDYDGMCYLCDDNDERITCDKLDVGIYRLNMEQTCCQNDYEVEYVSGTLTVLPRKLTMQGDFVKTYDSSNTLENPHITLNGVLDGDEVYAACDKLYFNDKNAGLDKTVMLANIELEGTDSRNYVLEGEARGAILPKQVEISGLVIRDKAYDGTTRAQIDKMGRLDGVIDGDSVAIGKLELSFAEAEAGDQPVRLDSVTLIGADKDNYVVSGVDVTSANINTTLWNKIFVKNPAITAQG